MASVNLSLAKLREKSLPQLVKMKEDADYAYYNTSHELMSDADYDRLWEEIKRQDPNHPTLKKTGISVDRGKVTIPVEGGLPSLSKVKPGQTLANYLQKYGDSYVYSDKMDGISALVHNDAEKGAMFIYTRGDGLRGQNVSKIAPFLIGKDQLPLSTTYFVRGELILKRATFERKLKARFANARAAAAGIINAKTPEPNHMKLIDFLAYEVISYGGGHETMSAKEQMDWLVTEGFNVAPWGVISHPTEERLTEIYLHQREHSPYDVDGLVLAPVDGHFKRTDDRPKHKVAYKPRTSDQGSYTTVKYVEWIPSKDGVLAPLVHLVPVDILGASVKRATGHNAKFIKENGIGPGATLEIVRSGDVIPFIVSVPDPAPDGPQLPTEDKFGAMHWNDTDTHLVLDDPSQCADVNKKQWIHFFRKIGAEGIGQGGKVAEKLIAHFDTIGDVLRASIEDFEEMDGFKRKSAEKLYANIHTALDSAGLARIAAASNTFGIGVARRKIQSLLDVYPDILKSKLSNARLVDKVSEVPGWNTKTAKIFADGLPHFQQFVKDSLPKTFDMVYHPPVAKKNVSDKWANQTVVFTGFRDKEAEERIVSEGGVIGSNVSRNTTLLVVKDDEAMNSAKAQKAQGLGVRIITKDQLATYKPPTHT